MKMLRRFTQSINTLIWRRPGGRGRHTRAYSTRRRATRKPARLPLKVYILDPQTGLPHAEHRQIWEVHTKELSSIGLSFVLSELQLIGLDLMKHHGRLLMMLGLPGRQAEIFATVASVSPLGPDEASGWFVIGVRITKMGEEDRAALLAYLKGLGGADEVLFEDLAFLD